VRVALDLRYRVESGASTYIGALLPHLVVGARRGTEFLYVRYAGQTLDGLPQAPALDSPRGTALRELAWLNRTLPRKLREQHIDLYHSLKLPGPVSSPVPMVHTVHSITLPRRGEFPMSPGQRAHNAYGNLLLRMSRRVIGVSEYVSDFVVRDLKVPRERVRTVPLGVPEAFRDAAANADASLFDTPGLGDAPYIVCVGNIEYVKNHVTAVRALAVIGNRVPHHLVIAGRDDKPAAEELRRVVRSEGLEDRVHLVGFLDLATLASCLARAQLQLHPSLSEGFGLAVLEGMCLGLPVIGSSIPGLKEVMGDVGRTIADPRDRRAIADAILALLSDPHEARTSADRGKAHAARFSWERAARQTLAVYDECLGTEGTTRLLDGRADRPEAEQRGSVVVQDLP
jgi:glycosyltransferase involved in cell wall biosynthesis